MEEIKYKTQKFYYGILAPSPKGESVTHVSGTMCYLCLRSVSLCPSLDQSSQYQRPGLVIAEAKRHFDFVRAKQRAAGSSASF